MIEQLLVGSLGLVLATTASSPLPVRLNQLQRFGSAPSEDSWNPCPDGYTTRPGDIYGWGKVDGRGGGEHVDDCKDCAELCTGFNKCLSFECSPTELKCNLNNAAIPDWVGQPKDWMFCVKPGYNPGESLDKVKDGQLVYIYNINHQFSKLSMAQEQSEKGCNFVTEKPSINQLWHLKEEESRKGAFFIESFVANDHGGKPWRYAYNPDQGFNPKSSSVCKEKYSGRYCAESSSQNCNGHTCNQLARSNHHSDIEKCAAFCKGVKYSTYYSYTELNGGDCLCYDNCWHSREYIGHQDKIPTTTRPLFCSDSEFELAKSWRDGVASNCRSLGCHDVSDFSGVTECAQNCQDRDDCNAFNFCGWPWSCTHWDHADSYNRCCLRSCTDPNDLKLTNRWKGWDVYKKNDVHERTNFCYEFNEHDDQLWNFSKTSDGYWKISNYSHEQCFVRAWEDEKGGSNCGKINFGDEEFRLRPAFTSTALWTRVDDLNNTTDEDVEKTFTYAEGITKTIENTIANTQSTELAVSLSIGLSLEEIGLDAGMSSTVQQSFTESYTNSMQQQWTEEREINFKVPAHTHVCLKQLQTNNLDNSNGATFVFKSKLTVFASGKDCDY